MPTDPRKALGKAIRKHRLALRMTQEQLAEKADLHWTYVSSVERGQRNVTITNVVRIAAALGMRVRDLVADL